MNDLEARYQELQEPYKKRKACGTPEPLFDELMDLLRDYREALAKVQEFRPTHRHYSGGEYQILMTARLEADPDRLYAIYRDNHHTIPWCRPTEEFFKKFTPINAAPKPEDSV